MLLPPLLPCLEGLFPVCREGTHGMKPLVRCAGPSHEHGQACPHGSSPPCRCSLERVVLQNLTFQPSIFGNVFSELDIRTYSGIHFRKPFSFIKISDFNMAAPIRGRINGIANSIFGHWWLSDLSSELRHWGRTSWGQLLALSL